jgi:hypothetical protein
LANESDHNEHREEQNKNHPITFVMVYRIIACFDSVGVRHTYLLVLVLLEPGTPDPHQAVGEESSCGPQQVTLYEVRVELLGFFVCQPCSVSCISHSSCLFLNALRQLPEPLRIQDGLLWL